MICFTILENTFFFKERGGGGGKQPQRSVSPPTHSPTQFIHSAVLEIQQGIISLLFSKAEQLQANKKRKMKLWIVAAINTKPDWMPFLLNRRKEDKTERKLFYVLINAIEIRWQRQPDTSVN